MRNKWFPARVADYVPAVQLKQLKAQDVDMTRDATFGVKITLEEAEEDADAAQRPRQHYVRPIEIEQLSVCPLLSCCERALTYLGRAIHGTHRHLRTAHD